MKPEQIDLIIKAAQVLQEKKEFYDYMIIVLPVLTGFIGWFSSIWWQSRTFTINTKKEQYYTAREKVESVVENVNKFLEYVYIFHKSVKNNARQLRLLDEDAFNDFITEYHFKLASIHQKLKIIFPGRRFPIEKVASEMNVFVTNITEMNDVVMDQLRPNHDAISIKIRIEDLNKRNRITFDNVTKEISEIENTIINILSNKAKDLGIKELG